MPQDLDFEFTNQVGWPDFAGGEARLLVDEDLNSPFRVGGDVHDYLQYVEDELASEEKEAAGEEVSGIFVVRDRRRLGFRIGVRFRLGV